MDIDSAEISSSWMVSEPTYLPIIEWLFSAEMGKFSGIWLCWMWIGWICCGRAGGGWKLFSWTTLVE